ncbi:hypothetical protein ACK31D_01700 [Aeromonas caviae]|uniref:hypothetical protein n=1 Tax=Aeromonas sp. R2-1 TaxID=3138459 RepID=UPI0034A247B8
MAEKNQKDVEDSNEVERLYRRNSLFAASVISIYSIAGGKLDNDVSVGFTKVSFSNPHALEYSLVVVAVYFCWRHWLVSKELRARFIENAFNSVSEPKWIEVILFDKIRSLIEQDGRRILDESIALNNPFKRRLKDVGFLHFKYAFSFTDDFSDRIDKVFEINVYEHPLVFLVLNIKYRFACLKNSLNDTHFGDGVIPILMMIVALILYSLNLTLR